MKLGQKRTTKKAPIKRGVGRPIRGQRGLRAKADRLFSQAVFERDNHTCQWCGKKHGQIHCHHAVVHRRYLNVRYVLDNGITLGATCHTFLGDHPTINADFMRKRIGSNRVEEIIRQAHTNTGKFVYLEVIQVLENKL